jgi:hypothetical protein
VRADEVVHVLSALSYQPGNVSAGYGDFGIVVIDPTTGSGIGYDGGGLGAAGSSGTGGAASRRELVSNRRRLDPAGRIGTCPYGQHVATGLDNLSNTFNRMTRLTEKDAFFCPNSNTFARKLLENAGYNSPTPQTHPDVGAVRLYSDETDHGSMTRTVTVSEYNRF